MFSAHLIGEVFGETRDTIKRGASYADSLVIEEVQHERQNLRKLRGNKVWRALNAHAQCKNTSTSVRRTAVLDVRANSFEKWDGNLTRGQEFTKNVKQAEGRTRRGDVFVFCRQLIEFGSDLDAHLGDLLANLQALDLELAETHSLHQEADGLRSVVAIDVCLGSHLGEELDEVTKVGAEQSSIKC